MLPLHDDHPQLDHEVHLAASWQATDENATTEVLEAEGYSFVLDD